MAYGKANAAAGENATARWIAIVSGEDNTPVAVAGASRRAYAVEWAARKIRALELLPGGAAEGLHAEIWQAPFIRYESQINDVAYQAVKEELGGKAVALAGGGIRVQTTLPRDLPPSDEWNPGWEDEDGEDGG